MLNDEEDMPLILENDHNIEDVENPLDQDRVGANETALISAIPTQYNNDTLSIAPLS